MQPLEHAIVQKLEIDISISDSPMIKEPLMLAYAYEIVRMMAGYELSVDLLKRRKSISKKARKT